jgi:hypothetical protein
MKKITELWQDIISGKLPILFGSEHIFQQGISPVSKYCNYESDENGNIGICTRKAWEILPPVPPACFLSEYDMISIKWITETI